MVFRISWAMDPPEQEVTDGQSSHDDVSIQSIAPVVASDLMSQFVSLVAQLMGEA